MNTIQKLYCAAMLAALLCVGSVNVQAQAGTYHLPAITSGTWTSKGVHNKSTSYQVGYSYIRPNEQAAYFEFDLTPLNGDTNITFASITVPGSTDYSINDFWSTPSDGFTNNAQFKLGCRPMYPESTTLATILTGNNNVSVWNNVQGNQDGGYGWTPEGLHKGVSFDCWHYEQAKALYRLSAEVQAGGDWVEWCVDRFDSGTIGNSQYPENYIWGSTSYTPTITLNVTLSK